MRGAPQSRFAQLISPMSVRSSIETFGLPTRLRDRQRQYARKPARCQRTIVRPETIVRWHRAGFRAYWRWRSRNRVGRPKVSIELRTLIGEMSCANRLWGAPRIHGELLKLGFEVAQSTVARTFLSNHADGIAAVDLFVLPTITFQTLYCLVILRHGRRFWMSFDVTSNPTAE